LVEIAKRAVRQLPDAPVGVTTHFSSSKLWESQKHPHHGTDVPVEEPSPRVLDWEASSFSVVAIQANNTLRRRFDQRTSVVFLAPKSRCDCRAAPKEKALFGAFRDGREPTINDDGRSTY
jgi:hypothetical protein